VEQTAKHLAGVYDDIIELMDYDISFLIEPWGEVKIMQPELNHLDGNEIIQQLGQGIAIVDMRARVDSLLRSKAEMTFLDYTLFLNLRKDYDCWFSPDMADASPNTFASAISLTHDINGPAIFVRRNHCPLTKGYRV